MFKDQPVNPEDIKAYAAGIRRSYGDRAPGYARRRAEYLKACGDENGAELWLDMAKILTASKSAAAE